MNNNLIIGGIVLILTLVVVLLYQEANNKFKQNNGRELSVTEWLGSFYDPKLINLIIGTTIVICALGYVSFGIYKKEHGAKLDNVPSLFDKIMMWINNQTPTGVGKETTYKLSATMIMVSMAFGVVFGFIDNAGLFFGMDALDPYFKKVSKDEKVVAGLGNTFSDVVGAFAGSFAGSIIKKQFETVFNNIECFEGPMWAEAVGIFVGCGLGVVIPKMITG